MRSTLGCQTGFGSVSSSGWEGLRMTLVLRGAPADFEAMCSVRIGA